MRTPRIEIRGVENVVVKVVDGWMDLKTAAAYMDKHPEHLRLLAVLKKIRHGRDGRIYKFRREHCDDYLYREGLQ